MTFKEWLTSSYPNPSVSGQWGILHIAVLLCSIAIIVALALLFRNESYKTRRIVLWVLVGLILFFEIARRIINLCKMTDFSFNNLLYTLLPRPWCAISCWAIIISGIFNKKFLYNITSITALLCAIIYFAYPGAGVNNTYILFENLYSISTHALLLITSISFITLRFAKFEYKTIWKELICLAVIFLYSFLEIWVLKISDDPLYFMPGNDVQEIVGLSYSLFIQIYLLFLFIYVNIFYVIGDRKYIFKDFKENFKRNFKITKK